ncbi:UVR8 [Scenedesmus sp. PABB004]|nr:UVR8 [Scenedesmus sp. PABB004]
MAAAPRRLLACLVLAAWFAATATSRDIPVTESGGTHRMPTRALRQDEPASTAAAVPAVCSATGQGAGSNTTTRCAQRCQVCVNDRTITTRNRTCLCCKAGFVLSRREPGYCRPCAPKTYSPMPGRARCMLCRGAFITLRPGSKSCDGTGTGWANVGLNTSIAGQTPGQAQATCCTAYGASATCGSTSGSAVKAEKKASSFALASAFNCSGTSQPFPNALYALASIGGLTPAAAEAVCCTAYPAGATCADRDGSLTAATQLLSCGNLAMTINATTTTIAGLSAAEAATACCTTAPAVVAVAASYVCTCALLRDTSVRCFGHNNKGQLGDGSITDRLVPVPVTWPGGAPLTGVAELAAGGQHTCARLANGTAACWGDNTYGQLGDGTNTSRLNPVAVTQSLGGAPLTGVASITAGTSHTCAALVDGTAMCWGINDYGQLGIGNSNTKRLSPVAVMDLDVPLAGVAGITAGSFHTCARLLANGTAACWGYNSHGELGDGTNTDRRMPAHVTWPGGALLTDVAEINAGWYHTCVRLANGTVGCWGYNDFGQLGDGTSGSNRPNPVAVSNLTGVTLVAAGARSTCVIAGSEVACFGENSYGQLGVTVNAGTGNANPTPMTVPGLSGAAGVAAGDLHTCAFWAGGLLECFGLNDYGQLGRNSTNLVANPSPEVVRFA